MRDPSHASAPDPMASSHIFKVVFVNQGKVYEIYARKVSHGQLFGFVEVEELIFGEQLRGRRRPVRGEDQVGVRGRQAHLPAAALGDPHRRGAQVRRQQGLGARRPQRHAVPVPGVHTAERPGLARKVEPRGLSAAGSRRRSGIIARSCRRRPPRPCSSQRRAALSDFRLDKVLRSVRASHVDGARHPVRAFRRTSSAR